MGATLTEECSGPLDTGATLMEEWDGGIEACPFEVLGAGAECTDSGFTTFDDRAGPLGALTDKCGAGFKCSDE
jgi:hypothetical protein